MMRSITCTRSALAILAVISMASAVFAQPEPGDVFKEYYHSCKVNGGCNCGGDTKRLGSGYGAVSPLSFTPTGDVDITGATKAEIFIEITECHEGTRGLQAKVNDGTWIDPVLPVSNFYEMAHFWFPVFPVDLADVKEGQNTITLRVSGGGSPTPQMLVVGTHLRVYYDPASKAHIDAGITAPAPGEATGKECNLVCSASGATKVEFLGLYEGVNWEGDGDFTQWHYTYFHGEFERHIGTDSVGPDFQVTWNTEWVPDQTGAKLAARVHGSDGTIYMTEVVDNIQICRPDMTVELGIPDPMEGWVTRNSGDKTQTFILGGDPADILGATVFERGWGDYNPELVLNGTVLGRSAGGGYNFNFTEFAIDAAKARSIFKSGSNSIMMKKGGHHGHEAYYPGMMTVVQFSASNDCANIAVSAKEPVRRGIAKDNLRIMSSGNTLAFNVLSDRAGTISLATLNGIEVAAKKVARRGTYSIDTSNMPNGVYLLKLRDGASEIVRKVSIAR
ncbi:MAG: T9SS type A sorting domain-containing protein [Chitinivibrionales bacterium]|nr:T9SS type A sorting domain-containing protein [Chitinivibrionales bacterium]MBD3395220.1 T9SS type A sorting domain-containing protein [Chitinivibrionales bacterium]